MGEVKRYYLSSFQRDDMTVDELRQAKVDGYRNVRQRPHVYLEDQLLRALDELTAAHERIAELERESARACTTALRKTAELLAVRSLADKWDSAWAEMYRTGDERIDSVSYNRAAAKRECATELRNALKEPS